MVSVSGNLPPVEETGEPYVRPNGSADLNPEKPDKSDERGTKKECEKEHNPWSRSIHWYKVEK